MKHLRKLLYLGLLSTSLYSCVKDTGNYEFAANDLVTITIPQQAYTTFLGKNIEIIPVRAFKNKEDSVFFSHAWYINGKLVSEEPSFKFVPKELTGMGLKYYMTDKRSGVTYTNNGPVTNLVVTSPYNLGWGILYEDKDGNSEIAHIFIDPNISDPTKKYLNFSGIYKQTNGTIMGSKPYKMFPYTMRGTRSAFIIQHGGQGTIDVTGQDYKRQLVARESFTREAPDNFEPVDFGNFSAADLFVNKNGDLYGRFFNGPSAFTIPWMSTPIQIEKGIKASDIWDASFNSSKNLIIYDNLNKRLLCGDGTRFYPNGGIEIKPVGQPKDGYPANFTPLDKLGNWSYLWGGIFVDNYGSITGGMLIKSPDDNKLYFQNFDLPMSSAIPVPKQRILFTGADHVDSKTEYLAIKRKNYLLFSGDNGRNLYYFDPVEGTTKLFFKYNNEVSSLGLHEDTNSIAVGLSDGQVILYDIRDLGKIDFKPVELHRITGLGGRVAHVVFKGYN